MKTLQLQNPTSLDVGVCQCLDLKRAIKSLEISFKNIEFGDVLLLSSLEGEVPIWCKLIKIENISNLEEYSKFCIKELGKYITTEFCLVTQWDGFVINPFSWKEEFLEYDYIGARWWWHPKEYNVGNGGFSLRSKKFLYSCIFLSDSWEIFSPEDEVCCITYRKELEECGLKFAPEEIALKFSIENEEYTNQFGAHALQVSNLDLFNKFIF